jgi:hypothetical protein
MRRIADGPRGVATGARERALALTLNTRSVTERRVDLLVNQLKLAIRELLARKGVRCRVLDKVNVRGEVVIGVILERDKEQPPSSGPPR